LCCLCVSRVGPGRVIFSPVELHKNNQQMEGEQMRRVGGPFSHSAISRNAKVPDRKSQKETVMYCAL
jgi:hypothetical protein